MIRKNTDQSYKHIWSVLCQSSSIDRDSNRLSILNTLEEIKIKQIDDTGDGDKRVGPQQTSKEPVGVPIEFEIVSMLERLDDKEKGDLTKEAEVELIDPQGGSLLKKGFEMTFRKGSKRLRYRIRMDGLKVTTSGTYNFYLRIKDAKNSPFTEVAELPLDIKFL